MTRRLRWGVLAIVGAFVLLTPGARADDATRQLAERYAPVVVIRDQPVPCGDGEPYLPTPVEAVLGSDDVVRMNTYRTIDGRRGLQRDWRAARALLHLELASTEP